MGRHWYPKRKVKCMACGWTGTRSTRMTHKACPKCRKATVQPVVKESH